MICAFIVEHSGDLDPDFFTGWWWLCGPFGSIGYLVTGYIARMVHERHRSPLETK
jgi:hypothetical protein